MNSISCLICICNQIPFWKQSNWACMPFASPNKLLIAAGMPVGFQPLIPSLDIREILPLEKSLLLLKLPKIEFYFASMRVPFLFDSKKNIFWFAF